METENYTKKKETAKILIVDDIGINVRVLENIIRAEGYEPLCALSVQEALDIMNETLPQLILSDLSMPGIGGLEFCKLLKSNPKTRNIPFIFISIADSREEKKEAFGAGAVDYITKPFEPMEVIMRVNNHLAAYRIRQEMEDYNRMMHKMMTEQKKLIEKERVNVMLALTKLVAKRNAGMGNHLERVGYNSRLLAQSLQIIPKYEKKVTDEFIEMIGTAARLHDIGTVVIPDEILLKQDASSENKREAIKLHTQKGAEILEELSKDNSSSRVLSMAIDIARYHHANWDGTGYPEGMKGSDIPLAARITAVANGFDNLIRMQCNPEKYSLEEYVQLINDGSGTIYDPRIVEVFHKVAKQMRQPSYSDVLSV